MPGVLKAGSAQPVTPGTSRFCRTAAGAAAGAGPLSACPMAASAASSVPPARRTLARPAVGSALPPRSPMGVRSADRVISSPGGRAGAAGGSARSLSGRRRTAPTCAIAVTRACQLSARSAGKPGPAIGSVQATLSADRAGSGRCGDASDADATAQSRRNGQLGRHASAATSTFAGIRPRASAARPSGRSSAEMITAGRCVVPALVLPALTTPAGNAAIAGNFTATTGAFAAYSVNGPGSCSPAQMERSLRNCSPCWRRSPK